MTASNPEDPDTGLSPGEAETLERLYRRGAPRSPAALDEAVLARAAEALNTARRRRQQRLGYFSLAASLTLVTGLVWQLREETLPRAPSRAAASDDQASLPAQASPQILADRHEAEPAPSASPRRLDLDPARGRLEADAASSAEREAPHEAAKKAAVPALAEQTAGANRNLAAPPAAAGSVAEAMPASPPAKAPQPLADRAAAAASAPRADPAAVAGAAASTDEVRRLLQAIRALPRDASFVDSASQDRLEPAAFADRLASADDVAALLKIAANWRLVRVDGTTVAADQWLRSQPASR